MANFDKEFRAAIAGEVVKTLLSSVPFGGVVGELAKGVGGLVVDQSFASPNPPKEVQKAVELAGRQVAASLLATLDIDPDPVQSGATRSALFDFKAALIDSEITIALLFQLELNPAKLSAHILSNLPKETKFASARRLDVIHTASEKFSADLIDALPRIPSFTLALARSALQHQSEVLGLLREIRDAQRSDISGRAK